MDFVVFILAHTQIQYKQFIRENNLDKRQFIELYRGDQLRGIRDFSIIRLYCI